MKTDIQKIKKLLGLSGDGPLTPEEKRRRAKFVIYPLFFLMFAGAILLIYGPTQKEREEAGKGLGFNTEIPSPEETRMEGNKVSAYERDALAKKERKRKDTFQEMSELFNRKRNDTLRVAQGGANVELPPEPEAMTPRSPVRSSTEAYRNMNRSLHTIHEPRDHPQDKELLRRIESLEKRQSGEHPDGGGQSLEEKMALMEKSYELAARYNGKQTTAAPAADRKERTAARPVKQVRQQVVSSLSRPANDEEGIAGERNTGFHTPSARRSPRTGTPSPPACTERRPYRTGRPCASGCWNPWRWTTASYPKAPC